MIMFTYYQQSYYCRCFRIYFNPKTSQNILLLFNGLAALSQNMKFSGRAILFNTVVSLVLVLRYLMTFLRNMGLAHKLPLDHNIYFHKVVGWIIFVQAWLHTISHLINFGERFENLNSYVPMFINLLLDFTYNQFRLPVPPNFYHFVHGYGYTYN